MAGYQRFLDFAYAIGNLWPVFAYAIGMISLFFAYAIGKTSIFRVDS